MTFTRPGIDEADRDTDGSLWPGASSPQRPPTLPPAAPFARPLGPPAGPSPIPPAGIPGPARHLPTHGADSAGRAPGRGRAGRAAAIAASAFLLGGAVGAGGFALGQRSNDDSSLEAAATSTPVSTVTEDTTGGGSATTPATIITETGVEPAAAVAQVVGPSVVQVETNIGEGSGVVYDDGLVLTNHHVIANSTQIQIRSADGRVLAVELVGSDPRNDVAVLRVEDGAGLPVAAIGSSAELAVGQLTVAIGSPFALQQTVTAGIVSSLNRPVPNAAGSVSAMIQTDAPINPGNSGGALANRNGEVVGINAAIRTDGTGNSNVGIGFAVPIDTAVTVANRIVAGDSLQPAVLGVSGARQDGDLGVPIADVTAGSAADRAGLEVGDRIVTIDGAPVTNVEEVVGLVQSHFAGDEVELQILRAGQELTLQAQLD